MRRLKGLAAVLGCVIVFYSVDAYCYDGWYATHLSTLLSAIYVHLR